MGAPDPMQPVRILRQRVYFSGRVGREEPLTARPDTVLHSLFTGQGRAVRMTLITHLGDEVTYRLPPVEED